jgi:hypothetical protein
LLALTTKESLLEFRHFGFQHVDLGLEFLGPGHRAPVLATVVMGLLTQGDHFGVQKPILLLERSMFRSERRSLALARWRGGPHAWGLILAGCPRRVPQKMSFKPFFRQTRSPNLYSWCLRGA